MLFLLNRKILNFNLNHPIKGGFFLFNIKYICGLTESKINNA